MRSGRNAGSPGTAPGRAAGSAKRVAKPFGAGPRTSPGRYLALSEMKMVAAMLLGVFEIANVSTVDGTQVRGGWRSRCRRSA
jgi:cytochrome P450